MDPPRPPVPPRPTRISTSDVPLTTPFNPLYNMHIASAAGQRVYQRANTSPSSFYPPHLVQHVQMPRPSFSQPAPSAPSLPASLMPGGGPRKQKDVLSSLESSLFFQAVPTSSVVAPAPLPKPPALSSSTHPYARTPPSTRRGLEPSPVLPPKPPIRAHQSCPLPQRDKPQVPPKRLVPKEITAPPMTRTTSSQSPISPVDQDELLARVLELSLQESGPANRREFEDDILARVLKESMAMAPIDSTAKLSSAAKLSSGPSSSNTAGAEEPPPDMFPSKPSSSSVQTTESHDYAAVISNGTNGKGKQVNRGSDLKALRRQEREIADREEGMRRKQLEEDEEFARELERQEKANASAPPSRSPSYQSVSPSRPEPVSGTRPANGGQPSPASTSAISPLPLQSTNDLYPRAVNYTNSAPTVPQGRPLPNRNISPSITPIREGLGRSASAQASFPPHPESLPSVRYDTKPPSLEDHRSRSESSPETGVQTPRSKPKFSLTEFSKQLVSHPAAQSSSSCVSEQSSSSSITLSTPISEDDGDDEDEDDARSPISPLQPEPSHGQLLPAGGPSSPHIEDELLMGISFGFDAPALSHHHEPMRGPIPHIITLPYSKAPPLHIQAPSWKQLLKLLTRLSESRVEPTVEALAGTKEDMRLRTVIQFVKVHHQSSDWRTIVYLSIDVPVPAQIPNAHKYTNGDVTVFPYSYTSSPLPGILRTGAGDSSTSKCFTVPSTVSTPFPKLPLNLPDFAMYLHSILRDSRRAANDTSGGLRRLAKMVDDFYPQKNNSGGDVIGGEEEPERRGVGGLFRRALGRERRKHGQSSGNADTYEYITPFRIDEYR